MQLVKGKKVKVATSRKRKNKDKNLVAIQKPEEVEVDLEGQNGELMIVAWFLSLLLLVTKLLFFTSRSRQVLKSCFLYCEQDVSVLLTLC
jgi:hypothetical protein